MTGQPVGAIGGLIEPLQGAGGLPAGKIAVPRRLGRKTSRQAAPLAARAAHVTQGINDLAKHKHRFRCRGSKGAITCHYESVGGG